MNTSDLLVAAPTSFTTKETVEDTDTQVRQRRIANKEREVVTEKVSNSKVVKNDEKSEECGFSNSMIANLLPAVASLALCLLSGGIIQAFPDALYPRLLAHSKGDPDGVWQLTEKFFVIVYVASVGALAVLLPGMALITKRLV